MKDLLGHFDNGIIVHGYSILIDVNGSFYGEVDISVNGKGLGYQGTGKYNHHQEAEGATISLVAKLKEKAASK